MDTCIVSSVITYSHSQGGLHIGARVQLTFRKSSAASISSITYSGVGLKWCRANTSARELSVFSPPDRFEMFFQLFLGGMTLNRMPSEKGSSESTSSSSALPPIVIIWYISL